MIALEHGFEGPFNTGYYDVTLPSGTTRVSGKEASLISLVLAGYKVSNSFQPLDAFSTDSLAPGRAVAKAVKKLDKDGSQ